MASSVLPSISNTSMPDDYVAPDRPSRCTWSVDKPVSDANPHKSISKLVACVSPSCSQQSRDLLACLRRCFSSLRRETDSYRSILPNALEAVGHTPMIRLDKIAKSEGLECELCEQKLSLLS